MSSTSRSKNKKKVRFHEKYSKRHHVKSSRKPDYNRISKTKEFYKAKELPTHALTASKGRKTSAIEEKIEDNKQ